MEKQDLEKPFSVEVVERATTEAIKELYRSGYNYNQVNSIIGTPDFDKRLYELCKKEVNSGYNTNSPLIFDPDAEES